MVSQVLFGSGRNRSTKSTSLPRSPARRAVGGDRRLSRFHGASTRRFRKPRLRSAFFLAGGYKYAMAGEGMGLDALPARLRPAPADHRLVRRVRRPHRCRPAESATPATRCASWARPSIRRRCTASSRSAAMLAAEGLTTARISAHVAALQAAVARCRSKARALADAELLNPLDGGPHARFLAFRSPARGRLAGAAAGAGLHHRRPRRRASDRARPLP